MARWLVKKVVPGLYVVCIAPLRSSSELTVATATSDQHYTSASTASAFRAVRIT